MKVLFTISYNEQIATDEDNFKIVSIGALSFNSSGIATKTVSGVKTTSRLIAQRGCGFSNKVTINAKCSTNGTVTFGSFDTQAGSAFSGAVSDVVLLIDNR